MIERIKSLFKKKDVRTRTTEASEAFMEDIFNYLHDSDEWLGDVFAARKSIVNHIANRDKAVLSYLCGIIYLYFDSTVVIDLDDVGEKYVWRLEENRDDEGLLEISVTRRDVPQDEQD